MIKLENTVAKVKNIKQLNEITDYLKLNRIKSSYPFPLGMRVCGKRIHADLPYYEGNSNIISFDEWLERTNQNKKEEFNLTEAELIENEIYVTHANISEKSFFLSKYNKSTENSKSPSIHCHDPQTMVFEANGNLGWCNTARKATKCEKIWLWACERRGVFVNKNLAIEIYNEYGNGIYDDEREIITKDNIELSDIKDGFMYRGEYGHENRIDSARNYDRGYILNKIRNGVYSINCKQINKKQNVNDKKQNSSRDNESDSGRSRSRGIELSLGERGSGLETSGWKRRIRFAKIGAGIPRKGKGIHSRRRITRRITMSA